MAKPYANGQIYKTPLPTPFPVGAINTYLIKGEPLTLVDTGPKTRETLASLTGQLATLHLRLEDIQRIIVTHGHVDHYGLAATIKARSRAKIYLHSADRDPVEHFTQERARFRRHAAQALREAGVPPAIMQEFAVLGQYVARTGAPVTVDHELEGGETLHHGELEFQVLHTPGHTPGSICLLERQQRVLIAGDTLLPHITPNAFSLFREANALGTYLATIDRLRQVEVKQVLPGHGRTFTDAGGAIAKNFTQYSQRRRRILRRLKPRPKSAYQLMVDLFGTLAPVEVALGLSEVLGHLGILVQERAVVAREVDGVLFYAAT